jgi:hypothetical protein
MLAISTGRSARRDQGSLAQYCHGLMSPAFGQKLCSRRVLHNRQSIQLMIKQLYPAVHAGSRTSAQPSAAMVSGLDLHTRSCRLLRTVIQILTSPVRRSARAVPWEPEAGGCLRLSGIAQ